MTKTTFTLGRIESDNSLLELPVDLVTQTIGIVAKKRVGKSYLAKRLTEGLLDLHQQVCIVDPKGDWWGLRSSADGKGDGYPIVIFGGERGDVPLEPAGGELVATFVIESGTSVLLDLSLLRKHEVATFMSAFLETLYRLKAKEVNRTPLMVVVDEADAIAPQKPQPNEARMLGAMQDIVRRGGQRGLGCTMVTQRTAVLNKDVLTQCQVLISMRTISPQDLKAMNAWIEVHGEREQQKTLMDSLPSLPVGDAWVWSPGWPTNLGIFCRIHTSPIKTFDSGSTPKPGEKRREPKVVKAIDLDKLRTHMAATIEQAKANDPRILKEQLAQAQRRVKQLEAAAAAPANLPAGHPARHPKAATGPTPAQINGAVQAALVERDRAWITGIAATVAGTVEGAAIDLIRALKSKVDRLAKGLPRVKVDLSQWTKLNEAIASGAPMSLSLEKASEANTSIGPAKMTKDGSTPATHRPTPRWPLPLPAGPGSPDMKPSQRKVLIVLAQHHQIHGDKPLPKPSLAMRAGYSQSGSFDTLLSSLRTAGWLTQGVFRITQEGLSALGTYERPPALGEELRAWWYQRISPSQVKVLRALEAGPLSKADLAAASGYSESGSFDTLLSSLRTLGLMVGGGRELMKLHEDLQ